MSKSRFLSWDERARRVPAHGLAPQPRGQRPLSCSVKAAYPQLRITVRK